VQQEKEKAGRHENAPAAYKWHWEMIEREVRGKGGEGQPENRGGTNEAES
jgi:hypothetical protein